MARFIFPDLSTFRKRLFYSYEQHRKAINENLGLIIALLATAAAFWTGYEARHARLEATEIGKQSLEKQQASVDAQKKSVDAQIEAMHVEQRPYVSLHADLSSSGDSTTPTMITVSMEMSGKTPALDVILVPDNKLENQPAKEYIAGLRRQQKTKTDFSFLGPTILRIPIANPGQKLPSYPYFAIATNESPLTFSGIVIYTDLFEQEHYTKFCFEYPVVLFAGRNQIGQCHDFIPEIN